MLMKLDMSFLVSKVTTFDIPRMYSSYIYESLHGVSHSLSQGLFRSGSPILYALFLYQLTIISCISGNLSKTNLYLVIQTCLMRIKDLSLLESNDFSCIMQALRLVFAL